MSSPTFLLLSDGRALNLAAVAYVEPNSDRAGERLAVWMARDIPVPDLDGADAELLRQAIHSQRWLEPGPPRSAAGLELLAAAKAALREMDDEWGSCGCTADAPDSPGRVCTNCILRAALARYER